MKKLLLLSAMSFACLNLNAQASDDSKEELTQSTSMSTKFLVNPKAAITTGFFDRMLEDSTKDRDAKLQAAATHVTTRKEKYELFLEQIRSNYFS